MATSTAPSTSTSEASSTETRSADSLYSGMDVLLELAVQSNVRDFRMTYPAAGQLPADLPTVRIPRKPKALYDRDGLVQEISGRLAGEASARLVICGGGGMGKTSVAAAVWHEKGLEEKFGRNRVWIDCDGLMSSDGLVPALAVAFSIEPEPGGPLRARVLQELQARDQPALLVLDNYGCIPQPSEENLANALLADLARVPHLSLLLITSDTESPVDVHWSEPSLSPLQVLDGETCRTIYLAHGGHNFKTLDELLLGVEGCPLAAVISANLSKHASSPDLLRTYEVKKTSVRGLELFISLAIESELARGSPETLEVLRSLPLLPDGLDVENTSKVYPHLPKPISSLATLKQLSLLTRVGSRIAVPAAVRQYILRNYTPDMVQVQVLAPTFLVMLDSIDPAEPNALVLQGVTKELGNITSILSWMLRTAGSLEDVVHSIQQLCVFKIQARYGDVKPLVRAAMTEARKRPRSDDLLAILALSLACTHMVDCEWNDAASLLEEIERLDLSPRLTAARLILYSVLHLTQHRLEEPIQLLSKAADLEGQLQQQTGAIASELLTRLFLQQGKLDAAEAYYKEAQQRCTSCKYALGTSRCQELHGAILVEHGEYEEAFRILFGLVQPYAAARYEDGLSRVRRALCRIHYLDGRLATALTGYAEAKRAAAKAHDQFAVADCERGSARTFELMQQPAAALELYKTSISLFESMDEVIEVAYTRMHLGRCMCDAQLPAEGLAQLSAAMAAFDYYHLSYPSAKCKQLMGKVLASLKAVNEGLSRLRAALGVFAELHRVVDEADCQILIGGICFSENRLDEAESSTRAAMQLYEQAGKQESKANCMLILASCYRKGGMSAEMRGVAQEGLEVLARLGGGKKADEGIVRMLRSFLGEPREDDDD